MGTDSPALAGTLIDVRPRTLLHFLGLTGKTGVLRVRQRDHEASVRLCAGKAVGADVLDNVVDMLRMGNGEFSFDEVAAAGDAEGVAMEAVLEQAAVLLTEWEDIAQVVPSETLVIELRRSDADERLSGDAWAVSVAVAGGHATPARIADHLHWGALRTCRAVKELVESRRASLSPPASSRSMLSGTADVVLTSGTAAAPSLWPGASVEAGGSWRTPWYDPGE